MKNHTRNLKVQSLNHSLSNFSLGVSLQNTPRKTSENSPVRVAIENPDRATYQTFKKIQGAQVLLNKYRQLKKRDLSKLRHCLSGSQLNLHE